MRRGAHPKDAAHHGAEAHREEHDREAAAQREGAAELRPELLLPERQGRVRRRRDVRARRTPSAPRTARRRSRPKRCSKGSRRTDRGRVDAKTLAAVRMPNRDGFVSDPQPDVRKQPKSGTSATTNVVNRGSVWRSSAAAGSTCPRRSGRSSRRDTASRPDIPSRSRCRRTG